MPVTTRMEGAVAVLGLQMPRANAINLAFVEAMNRALDEVERSPAQALVITGQKRSFCAGLDLIEAYEYDAATLDAFVDGFDDLFLRVFRLPLPVTAAINGHAIAGGCVLALAADYRIMAPEPATIGLNEVTLGIPFPAAALEICRAALPSAAWTTWFLHGRSLSAREALAAGAVHRVCPADDVLTQAIVSARAFCAAPSSAVRAVKADLKAPTLARIHEIRAEGKARFLEHWCSPAARKTIGAVREGLLQKKHPRP